MASLSNLLLLLFSALASLSSILWNQLLSLPLVGTICCRVLYGVAHNKPLVNAVREDAQGPWEHQFVGCNDITLHVVTAGKPEDPMMLFLHGFPESWYSWRHQIPYFASKGYFCVAPDMRGYNLSEKPPLKFDYTIDKLTADVKGLIHAYGKHKCVLVAHDWGGAIAWAFTQMFPEYVDRLVTLNMPYPSLFQKALRTNPNQIRRSWYIYFFQLPLLPERLLARGDYQIYKIFRKSMVNKDKISSEDEKYFKRSLSRPSALTAMLNYYRCIFMFSNLKPKSTKPFTTPTLMIFGERDTAIGKELTYGTENYVKDLTVRYLNASHWVQQDCPKEVNELMQDWLVA